MKYIITAASVLSGAELEPVRNGAVVVENENIIQVGTLEQVKKVYPDAQIMDLGEKCLMPGMFECHNHLAMDARLKGHLAMMEWGECEHTVMALKGLKDDLMSGVTTARCMGDRHYLDVKLKKMVQEKAVIGPDLLVSGIGMRASNGHGFVALPHSGVEEFRRTARENMYNGVDVLKIFVTPGTPVAKEGDFIPCYISYDEIAAIVDEAKRNGVRTAAHCIGGQGLDYCVKAGIDCIEHVYSITPEQVRMVEEEHKGWIDMTSGIVLDPEREPMLPEGNAKKMRDGRAYCTKCITPVYQSSRIRWTIGTDAYHSMLWKEVVYAVECGANPRTALKAVTSEAAKMCGVEEKTGQLTAGLKADIIAVEGNPLENVKTLSNVLFVMKSGVVYKNE